MGRDEGFAVQTLVNRESWATTFPRALAMTWRVSKPRSSSLGPGVANHGQIAVRVAKEGPDTVAIAF